MKVVQINANADFGSTGLVVQGIHDCLKKNGIDSLIVYQRCNIRPNKGYKVGNIIDWKLHAIMTRFFGHFGFYSRVATRGLLRYLDKEKPDVVHFHNLHSNYVNIKLLLEYLSKKGIPVVLTLHDCWFFTGKCFHYIDVDCEKFITGCEKCPKKKMPPSYYFNDSAHKDWLEKKVLFENIEKLYVVGCSKWISGEASKSFLKRHKITHIYNGVDISVFKPANSNLRKKLKIDRSAYVILGMANKWFQERNSDVVSKLCKLKDVVVIILGCSSRQLKMQNDFPSNVILEGFVASRHHLAEYYSISNLFINLTHADTLPTVNMESICCGTPVVTYDVGGCPELIIDGTGIVVKEDDIDGIVHAVQMCKSLQFQDCAAIGAANFSRKQSYSQYVNLYKKIIQK